MDFVFDPCENDSITKFHVIVLMYVFLIYIYMFSVLVFVWIFSDDKFIYKLSRQMYMLHTQHNEDGYLRAEFVRVEAKDPREGNKMTKNGPEWETERESHYDETNSLLRRRFTQQAGRKWIKTKQANNKHIGNEANNSVKQTNEWSCIDSLRNAFVFFSLYSHLCFFFLFGPFFSLSHSVSLNIHTNSFYSIAFFSPASATWSIESYYRQTKKTWIYFPLRLQRTTKSLTIYWEWDEKTVKNWNECALTKKLYILPEKKIVTTATAAITTIKQFEFLLLSPLFPPSHSFCQWVRCSYLRITMAFFLAQGLMRFAPFSVYSEINVWVTQTNSIFSFHFAFVCLCVTNEQKQKVGHIFCLMCGCYNFSK